MSEITVTQHTTAAPEKVWAVMTDVERWTDVIAAITKVERLDDGEGFGPGLRWVETRVMFGKEATEEMWVTEVDPTAHTYAVDAQSHGMKYHSVLSVTPAGDGSTISMTFAGDAQTTGSKILSKTVGKLFEGASRKALQQDLIDIATAAEEEDA